jgi:predicted RNase H-like nuclease
MRAALNPKFTYKAACDANEKQCGKRLPQQSYAILPKIREVDKLLQKDANLRKRVYEVHPEVSFYYWNEEKPMEYAKKSGFGFLERYKLVTAQHGEKAVLKIRKEHKQSDVADDDILDAIAAAWTARRIHSNKNECIPDGVPETDDKGLPMQMLA